MRTNKHISLNLFVTRKDHEAFQFWGDKEGFMLRLPHILERIRSEAPDTVGMQEVLNDAEALAVIASWAQKNGYIFKSVPYHSRNELCRLGFLVKSAEGIEVTECNHAGDAKTDVIQGVFVNSPGNGLQLFVNVHASTKDAERRHLAEIGLKNAVLSMLSRASNLEYLANVVVSGDMNAFVDVKTLPRTEYVESLRRSIKEAINGHLSSNQFDAVEVFDQAASRGLTVANHSFFPAPTDFLVTDVEDATKAIQANTSAISPDALAKLSASLMLVNNIFSKASGPCRLDLLFLCALSAKLENMVSDCNVSVLSVPTATLSVVPRGNIVAEMFHSQAFKGNRPDSMPAVGETALSDHSQLLVTYSL